MYPINTTKQNPGGASQPSGFLSPSSQPAAKPAVNLFGTPTTSNSDAQKPSVTTTGTPTLFSWPTNSASTPLPATTLKQNVNPPTTSGLTFKTPTTTMQSKPASSSTPLLGGGISIAATAPTATTIQSMPNFGIPTVSKPPATTSSTFTTNKTTTNPQITTAVTTSATPSLGITSATTTATTTLANSSLVSSKPATASSSTAQAQSLTFQQLEELILNKWTAELYEQEKVFLNQATQINIWDKIINENAEKLTLLHTTMEKVRKQQTKINDDLEVIFTHQKDLEACLVPMEKEDLLAVLKADPNRKNLYSNAKKIDSQIKSMSENLKETIEHINETSRSHDTEDPVIQVGRILNAHMESLRWIDEHTARMQDYFDSLLKIHDDLRRECDLNKRDVY